jgi:tRNA-dihydrouridine synthase
VTEFLSAEGIRRENEATLSKLRFGPDERTIGVQIFGADPQAMGDAARLVTDVFQPDFIDINFGCPVKIGLKCQEAGATALALHPRTRTQMYSGSARWEEIAAVVDALEIPVIGNGDIKTAEDAVRLQRQTGCAAVMIARGAFGQPWIFNQTKALLAGLPKPEAPGVAERFAIAMDHARMVDSYEADLAGAAIEFRKHLGWYVKGLRDSAELRKKLYAVNRFSEIEGIFAEYLAGHEAWVTVGHDESAEADDFQDVTAAA